MQLPLMSYKAPSHKQNFNRSNNVEQALKVTTGDKTWSSGRGRGYYKGRGRGKGGPVFNKAMVDSTSVIILVTSNMNT